MQKLLEIWSWMSLGLGYRHPSTFLNILQEELGLQEKFLEQYAQDQSWPIFKYHLK